MKVEMILDSVNQFFGDTSRSREKTRDGLEQIADLVDSLLEAMRDEDND